MLKKIIICLLASLSLFAWGEPEPTESPTIPVITLRSLNTGAPVENDHYGRRDPRNVHWELLDVDPNITKSIEKDRDGGIFVQFRALDSNKCFGFHKVTDCSNYSRTIFIMIPTDTGAFIIKDSESNFCLASTGYSALRLQPCARSFAGQEAPLTELWAVLPPFGPSKLLAR